MTAKELKLLASKAVFLRDGSVGNPTGRRFYVPLTEIEKLLKKKP